MATKCRIFGLVVGVIVALVGVLCGFFIFPKVVSNSVAESVKLYDGSDAYRRWEELPIPMKFKVYFFNVTNPDKIQLGHKPVVQEVGPFVYDQYRYKYNISRNTSSNELTYYQNQVLKFNSEDSHPLKETDFVTVANLPLMATINSAMKLKFKIKIINKTMDQLFDKPQDLFLRTTVRDFLFDGIPIRCQERRNQDLIQACDSIDYTSKKTPFIKLQPDNGFKFSLLSHKNNADDGQYTVKNGEDDVQLLGEIKSWKNSSTLIDVWSNETCNQIYGTDSTIFPPHVTESSKLSTFQSDICRSVDLTYQEKTTYRKVDGLRFITDENMLTASRNYSKNACYCLKKTLGITYEDGCLFDGALELQGCLHAPVVMTFPHFYLAADEYKKSVDGLQPVPLLHRTFVDLEPNTGVVLRGSKRAQFNIFYRSVEGIKLTENLTDSLMPVVWFDEGAELNDEMLEILDLSLFSPMRMLDNIVWSLIGLGAVFAVVSLMSCMFR
ncbi:hypothetical protein TKK_0012525 [Trichogramma kaykai]|uniref:Sensory neuron membrane protein 2 n=1 Tax=Trichogramma kaykai TaxID=54128 RepID=A0ABD2WMC1_9HYME